MMENCNYDRPEMLALNLVRGPVRRDPARRRAATSTTCATSSSPTRARASGAAPAQKRNGNLYPTHGLGPVANCLNINRGDASITSSR